MNPYFVRNFIYPLYRFVKRDSLLKKIKELENNQWLSYEKLEELQWSKLEKLIRYSYENVPYYRRLLNIIGFTPSDIKDFSDFQKIPVLTKNDIRKNFNELISRSFREKDLIKNSTSGSTGENIVFFNDVRSLEYRRANTIRNNRWCGIDIGDKEAFLWGAPFDIKKFDKLSGKIRNILLNNIRLSTYNMTFESMQEYAKILTKFKPGLITAYPTPLALFSNFLKENRIKTIRPRAIISSAETLFDYQRVEIEEAFACKVFNRYGSREFGNIAHECEKHNGLHISVDRFYLELLDNNGKPVQFGEIGEIFVTDLDNYGMPFIRYKIGDMGVFTDRRCSCSRGLPMIERVEGRIFDIIKTPSGKALGGTFWTLLSRAANGIKKFQVVQNRLDGIIFKIVPDDGFKSESLHYLNDKIIKHCGRDFKVDFQIVDDIPLTKSGKFRFVISESVENHEKGQYPLHNQ